MVKNKKVIVIIIALFLISIIFSGCTQQVENGGKSDQNGETSFTYKGESARFGFLGVYPDHKNEFDYEEMAKIGVGWIRVIWGESSFVWGNIEKVEGIYDFSLQDEFVKEMQKYGFNIFPVIWPYAQWD